MPISVKIGNRISKVEIIEKEGNNFHFKVDERLYTLDSLKVEDGVYSLIHNGHSINMEMIEGDKPNHYYVNTRSNGYHIEVLDARARYLSGSGNPLETGNLIVSPMPGKIVKILVKEGEKITKGTVLIIVSAMKMESEYRSPSDGTINRIFVNEGETVDGNQKMVEINPE
jgi:biotin carboxyl carrier protein